MARLFGHYLAGNQIGALPGLWKRTQRRRRRRCSEAADLRLPSSGRPLSLPRRVHPYHGWHDMAPGDANARS